MKQQTANKLWWIEPADYYVNTRKPCKWNLRYKKDRRIFHVFKCGITAKEVRALLNKYEMTPKPISFKEHLEWASSVVAKWPKWKQKILGGSPFDEE